MTNISGASVSCRMQLTTMSYSERTSASGPASSPLRASVRLGLAGSRAKCCIRTDAKGDATADTLRWVSTVTSLTPSADRPVAMRLLRSCTSAAVDVDAASPERAGSSAGLPAAAWSSPPSKSSGAPAEGAADADALAGEALRQGLVEHHV